MKSLSQITSNSKEKHATKILRFTMGAITAFTIMYWMHTASVPVLVELPKRVPGLRMEGIRRKIYRSQWIQLFPSLKAMIPVVKDGNRGSITSARQSSIELLKVDRQHRVGGIVKAVIISRNAAGRRKSYGGDFFYAILRRPGSDGDGVTCEISDEMNGSYSVSCLLPWSGKAAIDAVLIHPSESLYQLMKRYSSEKGFRIHQKTTMLNSNNETEATACSIGFPDKRPDELCDYTNPTHGEKRTCLKPPSGECPKIILYQKKVVERRPRVTRLDRMYCNDDNYMKRISGSGIEISVQKYKRSAAANSYVTGNLSSTSLNPMRPSGWLKEGKWNSFKTDRSFGHDIATMKACLSHKRLYFFGDSTARNLYSHIVKSLKIKDYGLNNSVAWSRGRDGTSSKLNTTIQYRSHGPPLNNPGPEDARPYMSDSFDAIRAGGEGTVVVFTIGYHFHYFDPDVYLRRLKIIKQAVISMLKRLPGARVIVKGLHYHWEYGFGRSPWLTYKFVTMLRNEFRDVAGAVYMEHWDYTLLRNNSGVHPEREIFLGTFDILMTHLCLL